MDLIGRTDRAGERILHCNMNLPMTLDQLAGLHARLRLELAQAASMPHWRAGRIDRLAEELVETERRMSAFGPLDEQTEDPFPGVVW